MALRRAQRHVIGDEGAWRQRLVEDRVPAFANFEDRLIG